MRTTVDVAEQLLSPCCSVQSPAEFVASLSGPAVRSCAYLTDTKQITICAWNDLQWRNGVQDAKVVDQTRGILTWVEQTCPGNFHSSIEYVTVAGKYLKGAGLRDKGASIAQKVVGAGYQQVCGDARVWGDGITPVVAAHLEGGRHTSCKKQMQFLDTLLVGI